MAFTGVYGPYTFFGLEQDVVYGLYSVVYLVLKALSPTRIWSLSTASGFKPQPMPPKD